MRLKTSRNAANEELVRLLNKGYELLNQLRAEYNQKRQGRSFDPARDHQLREHAVDGWGDEVMKALDSIFPTTLELNRFVYPPHEFGGIPAEDNDDFKAKSLHVRLEDLLKGLDQIRKEGLVQYTDLPLTSLLYIEDIDSFSKVRDVNPAAVYDVLGEYGRLDMSEDQIQRHLENILNEPFHQNDWGGEYNDLWTSNVIVNGARRTTAFLLKGPGVRSRTLKIGDCGATGDQLVRLFESPAELFVVQFVGEISQAIARDVEGKVDAKRAKGKPAWYCLIRGQDTARLLRAYGLL